MVFEQMVSGIDGAAFATRALGSSKKKRVIDIPNEPMRLIHKRLLEYLRSLPIEYRSATGCRKGNSPLVNVKRHSSGTFFYVLDLKSAYPSVKSSMLAKAICLADPSLVPCEKEVGAFVKRYCMSNQKGLATGAPASPDLFNLYCLFLLDIPLEALAQRQGLTYSRYVDDLVFSGQRPITRATRKEIRDIVGRAGFRVNHLKSQISDIRKGPVFINGIGLDFGGRVFVPRDYTTYIHGLLHRGLAGETDLQPKIAGAMGVFLGITRERSEMNTTERKIWVDYSKFRCLFHQKKRGRHS